MTTSSPGSVVSAVTSSRPAEAPEVMRIRSGDTVTPWRRW